MVSCESAAQLLETPLGDEPACILLDVQMAGLSGPQLQDRLAALGCRLPIVFISGHGDIPTTVQTIKAGAEDFLTKPVEKERLLAAIDRALVRYEEMREQEGQIAALRLRLSRLTPREHEVLAMLVRGKLHKQIAHELGTAERTVKLHRHNLMQKFEVRSLAELAVIAERLGLVPTPGQTRMATSGRAGTNTRLGPSRGNCCSQSVFFPTPVPIFGIMLEWCFAAGASGAGHTAPRCRSACGFDSVTITGSPRTAKFSAIGPRDMSMPRRQKIVAVVDDDSSMLGATRDLLEACGFVTRAFASAEEFLDHGAPSQVDCLLLDIHLGGMSGIELRRRLKISGATLPVIFITALDDEDTRAQAQQAGCVAFLRKPYSARQLVDAIEKAVL